MTVSMSKALGSYRRTEFVPYSDRGDTPPVLG